MINRMIVGNLVHRPVRSLISIVAVALEVTLILLIVGLSLGMVQDQRTRAAGIGADVIVLPPGSSFIAGLTGSPMPIKVSGILAKLPHVESVAPVITQISTALDRRRMSSLLVVPLQRFLYRPFLYWVATNAVIAVLRGRRHGWNKLQRRGTVEAVPQRPGPSRLAPAA